MTRNVPYKSVLRALDVLELVGAAYNGFRLKELLDLLGKHNAGALHILLYALVERGYLTRLEHPIRYALGPAWEAVNRKPAIAELRRRISPTMISICRQSGMKIVYQQLIAGHGFVLFRVNPATYFHVSLFDYMSDTYGTPVIFQAYMTPEEQDEFWAAHPMEELDRKIWGSFKNLRKYLKIAAKQRLAVIAPQHGEPFRVVGPIFDSSGKATAAIAAIQVDSQLTPQQANAAAQLIHQTAIELSVSKPSEISANRTVAYSAHGQSDCLQAGRTCR